MEGFLENAVWRFLSWLPRYVLRKLFDRKWLADHTRIDVRARHDPIKIIGGELPEIQIWLVVTNLGHFGIELDRLTVEFIYGGSISNYHFLQRTPLAPNETKEILVRGVLTRDQERHIAKLPEATFITLQVKAEFNCDVVNFSIDTGQLTGLSPRLLNISREAKG